MNRTRQLQNANVKCKFIVYYALSSGLRRHCVSSVISLLATDVEGMHFFAIFLVYYTKPLGYNMRQK